jgi:hypothetical protein
MQVTGTSRVLRRLAATTGLLLIMVATAVGADPPDADAATAAASQPLLTDVPVAGADSSKETPSTGDRPAGQVDDAGAFLGQLVTRYLDSFN